MKSLRKNLIMKTNKITKTDFIILGIIILFYTILSFINLGSFKNPQTFYEFNDSEEVIFKLKEKEDIIKVKLFDGELNGNYELSLSNDNKEYFDLYEINGNGAFSWNEVKILKQAKYIKLKAKNSSTLGSISFYNNSKDLINVSEITSSNSNKVNKLNNLIDEKDMIPDKINYLNSSYFDEVYFARTAYEYVNGLEAYEWVHPPLGKLIQAIPIKIFNTMAPFYYRLMGNIAGIVMIIVMYLFCKNMFKSTKLATLGSLLMTFDTFHFAQTRMGTVDSFLVLFIMISYFYMYKYIDSSDKKKTKYLLLSGLFFGFSVSVKWTGLFAGLGLAIIFFTYIIKNKIISIKLLSKCVIYYIVIPLTIYFGSYLLFPNVQVTYTDSVNDVIVQTEKMYDYHSKLEATHYFSSEWYSWPVSYKPVWYYQGEVEEGSHGTISGIGNVAIWWLGIITFLYSIVRLVIKKDKESYMIVIGGLCSFLPYIFIGRCMFLYHYFPVLPFIMLSIVNFFNGIKNKFKTNIPIYIYTCVFILVFIIYYPIISGIQVSDSYLENLKLLSSWVF